MRVPWDSRGEPGGAVVNPGVHLAIEVSQREGGVAVARIGEAPAAELAVGPPDPDRDRLMPAIDAAFRAASFPPRELAAVFVSIGPGGFTGLRTAVATAQALSLATGCALVAVPSAAVAAAVSAREGDSTLLVALASKGEETWLALVEREPAAQALFRVARGGVVDAAGFERVVREVRAGDAPLLVCDEHLPKSIAHAAEVLSLPRARLRPTAVACLAQGRAMLARGEVARAEELAPIYPREPEAVRLWRERQAARG